MHSDELPATLRDGLRAGTRELHAQLDTAVSGRDILNPRIYADFLQAQLSARLPVEHWLARAGGSALRVPPTAPLLVEDLHSLGHPFSLSPMAFAPPGDADPVGAAWALAGSSLGNRAMLARLRKGGASLPTGFLADPAMIAFWQGLKPRLDCRVTPGAMRAAAAAARAVFDCFTAAFATREGRMAA